MMQSYRHIRGRDDAGFKDRMVQVSLGRKYKSQVDREAWSRLKQINTLNREMLRWIIEQHLSKMNYMIDGSFEIPSFQAYRRMTGEMVLDKQMGMINRHGSVYVLNTSVFLVVDYHPSWFFSDVGPGE